MMDSATSLANAFVEFFLQTGRFEGAAHAINGSSSDAVPASARPGCYPEPPNGPGELAPFEGLAVRAVGAAEEGPSPACYIYVTRSSKKAEAALPSAVGGVAVHVRRVGRQVVRPEAARSTTNTPNTYRVNNKIACGSSVGPAGVTLAGTLGAFVERDGVLFCLSNNHVIGGCNHLPVGHPITSPSMLDAVAGAPRIEQFAVVQSLVELHSGNLAHVRAQRTDAALGRVDRPEMVTSMQGTFYDTPGATAAPLDGVRVMKVGRTTGLTHGVVESRIIRVMPLQYKDPNFAASVNYTDVWVVRSTEPGAFGLQGDSGALVVTEDGGAAVGLLFAVSQDGERAYVTSIDHALADLKGSYTLVTGMA